MALALVTGPVRPELFLTGALAVGVATVVYLVQPRAGVIALLALGTGICVACVVALFSVGTVPWLLTGFWGGAATLLAGLLDLIGQDGSDSMIVATVVAVVSLLLLSALGLGQYVRVNWTPGERAMLQEVPADVTGVSVAALSSQDGYVEQAPDGRWACHWIVRTRDFAKSWASLRLAVESAGWRIFAEKPGKGMTAEKDGYRLVIEVHPADGANEGTASGTAAPDSGDAVELIASLGAE